MVSSRVPHTIHRRHTQDAIAIHLLPRLKQPEKILRNIWLVYVWCAAFENQFVGHGEFGMIQYAACP